MPLWASASWPPRLHDLFLCDLRVNDWQQTYAFDLAPSQYSLPRIAGTSLAQPVSPASGDEIDRTRPGLMAVALRNAHIDRKVGAARERYDMIDGKAPAPVLLGQTIDADPPAEAAAVEDDHVVGERRQIDLARDDVGIERERATPRLLEPDVYPGEITGSHRSPSQRGARSGFLDLSFRVQQLHRR